MDWLLEFPQLDPDWLLAAKRTIDGSLKALTRSYGGSIEDFFYPLQQVLIFFEKVMVATPWPLIIAVMATIAWFAARRRAEVVAVVVVLLLIGMIGLWEDTMKTIALVLGLVLVNVFQPGAGLAVPLGSDTVRTAREMGISFGDVPPRP